MTSRLILVSAVAALSLVTLLGQAPAPIIVQAISEAAPTPAAVAPTVANQSNQNVSKLLQEMKAANEAILEKQAVTLQQLDEIEKAAEQLRIYSKRG